MKQKFKLHNPKNPLLLKFFNYIKKPTQLPNKNNSILQKLWNTIRLWGLQFTIAITLAVVIQIALSLFNLQDTGHAISENLTKETAVLMLIYGAIIAPIIEELTFRLPLKYKPINIGFFISFQFLFLLTQLLSISPKLDNNIGLKLQDLNQFLSENILITIGIYISIIFLLTITTTISLYFIETVIGIGKELQKKLTKLYPLFFYFIVMYFGLMHIFNYTNFKDIWFLTLLLVSPQIIIGLFLGYIRTQYGLFWAILNHMIHNTVTLTPAVLILTFTSTLDMTTQSPEINSMNTVEILVILFAIFFFLTVIFTATVLVIQMLVELFQYIFTQ